MAQSSGRKETPSFFDDELDPISAATSAPRKNQDLATKKSRTIEPQKRGTKKESSFKNKKKAGYYITIKNLERFQKTFLKFQLKEGWKGKPSDLMEAILEYGLEDIESGKSVILERLKTEK